MLLTIRDMHTRRLAKYSHYIAGPCRRYLELRFENGGFQFRIELYGSICRKIQFNSKFHGGELASNHPDQFLWRRKTPQDLDDLKSIDMNWNVVMFFFFRKTFHLHGYTVTELAAIMVRLYVCNYCYICVLKLFEFRLIFHWILFLKAQLTNPALVLIMAWRQPGNEPLSETMMVRLPTQIRLSASMSQERER